MTTQHGSIPGLAALIFGPQAMSFNLESFNTLRSTLFKDTRNKWALDTLAALLDDWNTVSSSISILQHFDGRKLLGDLKDWLEAGQILPSAFPLPNTLLAPLVVIDHLMSYAEFVQAAFPDLREDQALPASAKARLETLGLSLGTLSAFAVSCSSSLSDLQKHGAVAIRLAMLVGAVGDAEDFSRNPDERAVSFSPFWKSPELYELMVKELDRVSEAYVSVTVDEKRATITTSKSTAAALMQQLRSAGLYVAEVSIRGRFHWSGHEDTLQQLIEFCDRNDSFQFPDPYKMVLRSRSVAGEQYIEKGSLHAIALRAILVELSQWYQTINAAYGSESAGNIMSVTCFGPERCVPPALVRKLGSKLTHILDIDLSSSQMPRELFGSSETLSLHEPTASAVHSLPIVVPEAAHIDDFPDERIAVIGMACNVPGGEDMDEFWTILAAGESQHQELPTDRFEFETPWRETHTKTKWFGNLIEDYDIFDHKFFKKGPREMLNTDPQHRLLLHAAYQTLEQSGYFGKPDISKHIACFLGIGHDDYSSSVHCYPPNAYTATGILKSMAAGKISHHFGWTGPILTIDTACSSSSVAIHYACRSILSGEVTAALAGGSNVLSTVDLYQDLSGAQFLSPTGQCKPFDAKADGYCRGDGIGLVFLKKLSTAIADGDQIFGVIAGSRVYQNIGSTTITVPNADSLSTLFTDITKQARIDPAKVSVVEAHGTGTPIGDPVEYEAVCKVFGGSQRSDILSLSSVKGLFGHTEGASGVCSLLKLLLMMYEGAIPPQASYSSLNPAIKATSEDNIEVPTRVTPWQADTRIALLNNYGASGSNSSLLVTEAPSFRSDSNDREMTSTNAFPFWIPGLDEKSVQRYATRMRRWIQKHASSKKDLSARNLSFQMALQSNRTLPQALIFKANSTSDLEAKLTALEQGDKSVASVQLQQKRPVILCFGGQISTYVGLDKQVYEEVEVFRNLLNQCNASCVAQGFPSIYPDIFERSAMSDIVKLQLALFSTQYSCARTWMECGVKVAAVVGHSFGELTAMCISGAVSLQDAIKMIAGRANLIRNEWGKDSGAMMAVDADISAVEALVTTTREASGSKSDPSIACYNGKRSFTLAGSSKAVDLLEDIAKKDSTFSSVRMKKLNVTNAFHSVLVDDLSNELNKLGETISFNTPTIRWERATEEQTLDAPDTRYVSHHMRNPVYFSHAVQRLAKDFPAAIWLEAGSNSTITTMANRALGSSNASSSFSFHAVNITTDSSFGLLVDTVTKLWKDGLNVAFWSHHHSQTHQYSPLILPPYQFEKSRHWLQVLKPPKPEPAPVEQSPATIAEPPKEFLTFVGHLDEANRSLRFRINSTHELFQRHVSGHICAGFAPVWPSSIQMDLVIDALMNLKPEFKDLSYQPQIRGIFHHRPLLLDNTKSYWLDFEPKDEDGLVWEWKFNVTNQPDSKPILCTSGLCSFRPANDPERLVEFEMLERLSGRKRCVELLNAKDVENVMQGPNIYRAFAEVIDYTQDYRHVAKLVGRGNESAAKVNKTHYGKTWLDYILIDSLGQTAGMFVNLMTDKADLSERGIFMCESIGRWLRSPKIHTHESLPSEWEVLAVHNQVSEKKYLSDIFAFDPRDGSLVEVILGASYNQVPLSVMRGVLGQPGGSKAQTVATTHQPSTNTQAGLQRPQFQPLKPLPLSSQSATAPQQAKSEGKKKTKTKPQPKSKPKAAGSDVAAKTRTILENLTGVEADSIKNDSNLIELGLDSLLGMELIRDAETAFKVDLDAGRMLDLTDFASLVAYVRETLGDTAEESPDAETEEDIDEDSEQDDEDEHKPDTQLSNGMSQHDENKTEVNGYDTNNIPNGISTPSNGDTSLASDLVLDAFGHIKGATDDFVLKNDFDTYCEEFMSRSNDLSFSIFCNALEELGCSIRSAAPGTKLERIEHLPRHQKLVDYMYTALEKNAGLIEMIGSEIIRTSVACPNKDTETMLKDLLRDRPAQDAELKLMRITGGAFAKCLSGKADALQLLFGSAEGRTLLTKLYATSTLSSTVLQQLEVFIEKIGNSWPTSAGPLRILEVGAGTGGTTMKIVPVLARLGIPVIYTMTDLSSFFIATARPKFKQYPFVEFKVVDIEKEPDPKLLNTQHIILGSNVIHATRNLSISLTNIRKMLRPDGITIYHELTTQLLWADVIFGLVEGWWLFEDGRQHALQSPEAWKKVLKSVGYGHVDWTDGNRPEAKIQNLIFAMASDPGYDPNSVPHSSTIPQTSLTVAADCQTAIDTYLHDYTKNFHFQRDPSLETGNKSSGRCVLITGATGSLGAHLVAYFVGRTDVERVVCFNRITQTEALARQEKALDSKGISLNVSARSKLQVVETDTSKPQLGLSEALYANLVASVTDIVHNAWPMSINRPIRSYEAQFKAMLNLINLAHDATVRRRAPFKFGFQFVSSIGVVGRYPLLTGKTLAPEERMPAEAVVPSGYGYAKLVCERMLDETLHKFPDAFLPMAVRINQIAGSTLSGYWNGNEHLVFLIKSSQTLNALPDLRGHLTWCPVDIVAATLGELLLHNSKKTPTYPIYHIENPCRQSYRDMITTIADILGVPYKNIIPFDEWVRRVREFPGTVVENPAKQVVEFFDEHFIRMSCGDLVLDTKQSKEGSVTLRGTKEISKELVRKYIDAWRKAGVLK